MAAVLVFFALLPASPRSIRQRLIPGAPEPRVLPPGWLAVTGRRRPPEIETVAQLLELTARALRGGASLLTALGGVAAELPESELGPAIESAYAGMRLNACLDRWSEGSPERQRAAAVLVLGYSSGAAMASSLDRAAATLRQRQGIGDEIRALTAQTRLSTLVVALAPAGFAAVVTAVDRDALRAVFTTRVGLVSLVAGLALEALGVWWMRRLSSSVARWV